MLHKAAVGGALGEVLRHRDGDVVEYKDLQKDEKEDKGRFFFLNVWTRQNQTGEVLKRI